MISSPFVSQATMMWPCVAITSDGSEKLSSWQVLAWEKMPALPAGDAAAYAMAAMAMMTNMDLFLWPFQRLAPAAPAAPIANSFVFFMRFKIIKSVQTNIFWSIHVISLGTAFTLRIIHGWGKAYGKPGLSQGVVSQDSKRLEASLLPAPPALKALGAMQCPANFRIASSVNPRSLTLTIGAYHPNSSDS